MKTKSILSALIIFLLCVCIISCSKSNGGATTGSTGGTPPPPGGGSTVAVDISGMSYSPSSVTVKIGTIVKWTNSDYYSAHTVTSDDGGAAFNSGNIAIGATYNFTPTKAGTFPYHCTIHGTAMAATLTVTN